MMRLTPVTGLVTLMLRGVPFVRRDDLQVRTLYEPRTELNQYGEDTVLCIKGVYNTSIGAGSPILARPTQWKIVPKRAIDLAVDLQDGKAVPRSSVNSCTGEENPPPVIDLTKPLSRNEKHQLTNRIRVKKPIRRRHLTHGTAELNEAISRITEEVHFNTGITISRAEALHLMAGGKSCINGHWCKGTNKGEIFSASSSYSNKAKRILKRVVALADKTVRS